MNKEEDKTADDSRKYDVELCRCIHKDCGGEVYELAYDESVNWITAVYKCGKCGRDFTVKIEV
ncbi:MAG: hypothetical protein Q8896_05170 [Bacteroidota bacterium]|nr:hypothetical protein [Bacteroidota bacterium]MDP4237755.1 hypothetical protein [Bacteroidota bacterium]